MCSYYHVKEGVIETKVCLQCGEEKPVSEFHKHKAQADGYNRWCKVCRSMSFRSRAKHPLPPRLMELRAKLDDPLYMEAAIERIAYMIAPAVGEYKDDEPQ